MLKFLKGDEIQDIDTTEGDGAPGNQDKGPESTPREPAKGSASMGMENTFTKEAPSATT